MINYLIAVGIALISSVVLFFLLKKYKKMMLVLIVGIWSILVLFICLKFTLEEPVITLIGDKEITLEVNNAYTEHGAIAKYQLQDITRDITVDKNIDMSTIGTYKVTYSIAKNDKFAKIERTINVIDKTPPEIKLKGDNKVIASGLDLYEDPGYIVEDNYDKDLDNRVNITIKKIRDDLYKKTYEVTDSSGNKSTAEREIEIKDIIPPTILLNGSTIVNIRRGRDYEDEGATAIDDLDGDISESIEKEGNVDTNTIGTYTITYQVKDSSGNVATATRKVQVVQREKMGEVYLTFDDGPSLSITPHILDILKEEDVKATFFILNYNDNEEYLIKRIVDEGHTIAIHGYSHNYDEVYSSDEACMSNITKLRERIKATTGVDTKILRFPGGSSNTISDFNPGIMTRMTQRVLNEGYHYFDWNIDSKDAWNAENPDDVYRNVTWTLKEKHSNVVLMHDFSGNTKTLNALKGIIQFCKDERL